MGIRAEIADVKTLAPGLNADYATALYLPGDGRAAHAFLRVREATIRWAVSEQFPEVDIRDEVATFAALRHWKDQGDYRAMPDDVLPL